MTEDQIVQEVREIRHQIEKEYGQDFKKYYQHLKTFQKKLGKRLVCRKPNLLSVSNEKVWDNYQSGKF